MTWTFQANFDGGTVGALAQGTSGMSSAGTTTTFSDDVSHSGSKSCKFAWKTGDGTDTTMWRNYGTVQYPSRIYDGGEIWLRGYFYFASPWSWVASPVVKVMRVHIANASGGHVGYHSVLGGGTSTFLNHIIMSNETQAYQPDSGIAFDIDQWQCIEMYIKFSTTSPTQRVWKNGVLILNDTTHKTLKDSTDYADFTYLMSYWNGVNGCPQNQNEYLDDLIVTTAQPAKQDAAGNYMIGATDVAYYNPSFLIQSGGTYYTIQGG